MKALALICLAVVAVSAVEIDPVVYEKLHANEAADVFVHFGALDLSVYRASFESLGRNDRRQTVRNLLGLQAESSQRALREELKGEGVSVRTMWINNSLLVRGASAALVDRLAKFPGVEYIEADDDYMHIGTTTIESIDFGTPEKRLEYGIEIINAPTAWETTTGEGIVIANIDTGVRYTHEALVSNYRGNNGNGTFDHDYNWCDPRATSQVPFDNNGHGTHTMGTIAGSMETGIGVAPGSRWIAAKGCASSSCSTTDLLASFEYVLCPTRQDGTDEDCSKGADVVSNSWGGGRGSSTYKTVIEACLAAGMNVLFSQGNSGPLCSTANSPGDLAIVIGVGSTDSSDSLSSFSSRGPGVGSADFPLQKPDISAPGGSVRSAYYLADNSYTTMSGTSMACPHAAGVVGLMRAANPSLNDDAVRDIMYSTAETSLGVPNGGQTTCSGVSYTTVPNYHYGWGRIDAGASVATATKF